MTQYEFITLRYRHDAMTGEFINIGVLLLSNDRFLGGRFCSRFTRMKQLFGSLQKSNHKHLMSYLQRHFDRVSGEVVDELVTMQQSITELAHRVLPPDDSAYQWSEIKRGLTADPEQELNHLYKRLVTHYENRGEKTRRSDDDVWSSFNSVFREKQITRHLIPKKLETPDYAYNFDHAFKNGAYHLYEPLAFDYEDASKIAEKAVRWRGRGDALSSAEDHKFWFLVGEVDGDSRRRAVEKALNVITAIRGDVEIVREQEKASFAEDLSAMIKRHEHD